MSNFDVTDISATYGTQVSQALAGLGVPGVRFVIDTSRHGNGAMDGAGQHVDYCILPDGVSGCRAVSASARPSTCCGSRCRETPTACAAPPRTCPRERSRRFSRSG
ncbi:hypothetical protein [Streptomyces sp. NBC_00237]|uniref:hypothetical protein n=1 Tax=Streptomyces sp. NBC_00237 TaxID=2975687 RepID=UPI002B1D651A|nr:hypothetical protein [Streptomyces sp. NBC_00237]